ncbi:hypothetical protein BYT27DRAFT_7210644 [Phlegmacium glaucopus]|nr:hypothetical protein BYT27DRAFT_7210644 [Phlegmacium glaucopus]
MATLPTPSDIDQSASLDGCDKPTRTAAASPPFDDPKADLIIRSSDNIHFYVHKSLLSILTPVFDKALSRLSLKVYDDRPCLTLSDDSRHVLCLLSWCDPRCKRPSPSLDNLTTTLEMADKYDMKSIFTRAQKELLAHDSVESEPLRIFAIAIRFRLDDVARRAAPATLRVSLARCHNYPELKHISAFALQNLHNYHFKCRTTARAHLASDSWAQVMKAAARHLMSCKEAKGQTHTHGVEYFSLKRVLTMDERASWLSNGNTARWWSDYVEVMMFRLNDRPSGFSVPLPLPTGGIRQSISRDKCNQCKKYGYERLNEVWVYFSRKIEEVVSKVPFNVEY